MKNVEKQKQDFKASRPKEEQDENPDMPVECISDCILGKSTYVFRCERCGYTWNDNVTPSRCSECGSAEVWVDNQCQNCGSSDIGWFCPKCHSCRVKSLGWDYGHIESLPIDFVIRRKKDETKNSSIKRSLGEVEADYKRQRLQINKRNS